MAEKMLVDPSVEEFMNKIAIWMGLGALLGGIPLITGCGGYWASVAMQKHVQKQIEQERETMPYPAMYDTSKRADSTASIKDDTSPDCPQCWVDFAIYDPPPQFEDDGVWEEEVATLETMCDVFGWTYHKIDYKQINEGLLENGGNRRYRALIAPGGWAYYRMVSVDKKGDENIRQFIRDGGNFIGFCAGAYWAVHVVDCAIKESGELGMYTKPKDYEKYTYDLNLFDGVGKGPFGWMPWKGGANANLDLVAINTDNPTMKTIGLPAQTRFFYGGGPFFTGFKETPENYEVWARAVMPPGTPDYASTGNNEPTVIRFSYGQGSVILFAYHPEVLIKNMSDRVQLYRFYNEDTTHWNLGNQTWGEINLNSWNIVHAAMQIGANEKVTPLKELPPPGALRMAL